MPVNTLLTLGCGDCQTCGNPPPGTCHCGLEQHGIQPNELFVRINSPAGISNACFMSAFVGDGAAFLTEFATCGWLGYGTASQTEFTDSDGDKWRGSQIEFSLSGTKVPVGTTEYPYQEELVRHLVLRVKHLFSRQNVFKPPRIAEITYEYLYDTCNCPDSATFAMADFVVHSIGWPAGAPGDCTGDWTEIELVNIPGCGSDACAANCCTDIATDIPLKTYNVVGSAGLCDTSFSSAATVSAVSSCVWTWTRANPFPTPDCFTDSNGDGWAFDDNVLRIESTDTAGMEPCTTLKFHQNYTGGVSGVSKASQVWSFDFAVCEPADIPTTSLPLLGTSHTFPYDAPPFRTVTITPS